MRVAVLGSGSWGTALTILLARNGHEVVLLGRSEEEISMLMSCRENLRYLAGFIVPEGVSFGVLPGPEFDYDLTVMAVPSSGVREVMGEVHGDHPCIAVASKGIEGGSGKLLCDVVGEVKPLAAVSVLSGPNLAVEIARGIPTVAVAASSQAQAAQKTRDAFMCSTYRVSTSEDVVGIEVAGALKNVLAIGAGISDGLGFGDNTKGAFLSRGLMEMARLGLAMGAKIETFLGPAGVGDLFATAASKLSRNYRLGVAIAEGHSLSEACRSLGQVAEGVPTSDAVHLLARREGLEMPVFAAVEAVLKGRIPPKSAVALLMEREVKMDHFLPN